MGTAGPAEHPGSAELKTPCNRDGVNSISEIWCSEMNMVRARGRKTISSGIYVYRSSFQERT